MGIRNPVLVMTDWAAGKQHWRHGLGLQLDPRRRFRDLPRETPLAWYTDIQEMVDTMVPSRAVRRGETRWTLVRSDGRVLVLEVRGGHAELLAYYHRLHSPR